MAGVIDHPLIELADQIVARTQPVEERASIQRRLYNIILYIKRVENKELTQKEREFLAHRKLGITAMAASQELADGLRDRIRIINEYHIESAFRIYEMLEYGFEITSPRSLSKKQVLILQELVKDPMMKVSQLSTRLNKSRHTVTKILNELEEHFALSRLYVANRGKLKLSSFILFFQTKSYQHSKALESWVRKSPPLFGTTLVFDVTFRNGYLGYAIPSQHRAYRLFTDRLRRLEQTYFKRTQLQELTEHFWNIRFDYYDSGQGQWLIPPVLKDPSELPRIGQTENSGITYCTHADLGEPGDFDCIDLLITKAKIKAQDTIANIQAYLTQYGYQLPYPVVSQRINRLTQEGILFPHLYFSGAGIEEFVGLGITCQPKTRYQLQILASYFPLSFTYLSKQGITIFIKLPMGWRDFFSKFVHDLPSVYDIGEVMVVHQERNFGSGLKDEVYVRWNEKRQYWEFTDDEI